MEPGLEVGLVAKLLSLLVLFGAAPSTAMCCMYARRGSTSAWHRHLHFNGQVFIWFQSPFASQAIAW